MPLAGLSLIIIGGLRKISKHHLFWLSIALLIVALTPLINNAVDNLNTGKYVGAFFGGHAEWSYFPVFPWLAYPLSGLAIHSFGLHRWKLIPSWGRGIILGVSFLGFIFGFRMGFDVATVLPEFYHHNIVFFLWALTFIVIMVYVLSLMNIEENPLRVAFLSFAGKEVTLIYVIQWVLIGNIAAWLGKETLLIGFFAWTLSFILGSALLAYIYRKITSGCKN